MFSKLAARSVHTNLKIFPILKKSSCFAVIRTSSTVTEASSTSVQAQGSEVLPRKKRPIYPGKVRIGFIPEEWFQFFYKKTGVTGPYVFGFSLLTYLYSKEILLMDHNLGNGIALFGLLAVCIKKFGTKVANYIDEDMEKEIAEMDSYQKNTIDQCKNAIASELKEQDIARSQNILFDAKRENIGLQLEAAYRQRLVEAHSQVKRKLDYHLENFNVRNRFEHKHMIQWIVNNVRKSITPAQESSALKQCLVDLKAMSARA